MTLETERAYAASIEVQGLEDVILLGGDAEITVRRKDSAGCSLVRFEGLYRTLIRQRTLAALETRTSGKVDECGTSVNDTSCVCQDCVGAVCNTRVETPIVGYRFSGGEITETIAVSPD